MMRRRHWLAIVSTFAIAAKFQVLSLNLPPWDPKNWTGPPAIDPFSPSWPNSVAMCALMKEEHFDDIEEWLAYHRWIGVDHVFLFEDAPAISDELQAHLQPWIDIGFLDLTALDKKEIPYTEVQVGVYRRCGKPDMGGGYSWVMNTDLDEFLIILEDGKASRNPKLKEVLTAFRNNAGIVLQNVMFGSSGHDKRPSPGGPLRFYLHCNSYVGPMFKNLANTYWLFGMAIHNAVYRYIDDPLMAPIVRSSGAPIIVEALDEQANKTELNFMAQDRKEGERARWHNWMITKEKHTGSVTTATRMVLFHYGTRSKEDYFKRKLRITRDEAKRVGSPFATSLFGGDQDPERLDDKWWEELQKRDYPVDFGICREAVEAKYADAAREVGMHARAMSQPLMELQAPSISRRLQMPRT